MLIPTIIPSPPPPPPTTTTYQPSPLPPPSALTKKSPSALQLIPTKALTAPPIAATPSAPPPPTAPPTAPTRALSRASSRAPTTTVYVKARQFCKVFSWLNNFFLKNILFNSFEKIVFRVQPAYC